MSKAPSIAVVGATGYIGKIVMPFLYEALEQKRIKELRILTRKASPAVEQTAKAKGATVHEVQYNKSDTLVKALSGVDVMINMMGLQGDDWKENKEALVDALAKAGVSVYIPSEFGTYHYVCNYRNHPIFELKAHHFEDAKKRVPKVVGIFTALMTEQAFFKPLGFDNEKEVWTIVGDGDVPVSVTANDDCGRFTVEAAIMSFQEPDKIPEHLIISSTTLTFQQYAEVFDKYAESGNKTKIVGVPLQQAKADWEVTKKKVPVFMVGPLLLILMAEGHFDHSIYDSNEILNPGQSKWKLRTIEEYAKAVKGRPWVGRQPFDVFDHLKD